MLKTAVSLKMSTSNKLDVGEGEGGDSVGGMEIAKKSEKLKGQKLFKSQKPAKSGKNLSKSGNLLNFNAKNSEPSFLTPKTRVAFKRLRLAFIKAPFFDILI